jgi:hypothetical protein
MIEVIEALPEGDRADFFRAAIWSYLGLGPKEKALEEAAPAAEKKVMVWSSFNKR